MNGIDNVILIGNITQEPLVKQEEGKRTQMFINIAVNREYKRPDGTRNKTTDFIPVAIFGERANGLLPLLKQGTCVCVQAHHTVRENFKISIIADNVQVILPKREEKVTQNEADNIFNAAVSVDFDTD